MYNLDNKRRVYKVFDRLMCIFFYLGNFIYFLVEFIWVLNNAKQKRKKKKEWNKRDKTYSIKKQVFNASFLSRVEMLFGGHL